MNDTPPDVQARMATLLAARTGSERVEMCFSMFASAKKIVEASIRHRQPHIGDAALKAAVFRRVYVSDFSPEELERIATRIERG